MISQRNFVRSIAAVCGLVLAVWATPVVAQEQEDMTFEDHLVSIIDAATASTEVDHRIHLETLSCGEFVSIATSAAETDRAVASMIMVWAHGYHSGLKGINFEARPVSMEAMIELTKSAIGECRNHPDMLFHTAVSKLD
jgi:hypothetical protein